MICFIRDWFFSSCDSFPWPCGKHTYLKELLQIFCELKGIDAVTAGKTHSRNLILDSGKELRTETEAWKRHSNTFLHVFILARWNKLPSRQTGKFGLFFFFALKPWERVLLNYSLTNGGSAGTGTPRQLTSGCCCGQTPTLPKPAGRLCRRQRGAPLTGELAPHWLLVSPVEDTKVTLQTTPGWTPQVTNPERHKYSWGQAPSLNARKCCPCCFAGAKLSSNTGNYGSEYFWQTHYSGKQKPRVGTAFGMLCKKKIYLQNQGK